MLHNKKTKNIPKEWSRKKLGELFDITSSKRVFRDEWKTNGVPFYRAREIVKLSENGTVDNELFITREMYNSYKEKYGVPRKNDLLVTGVGTVGVLYRVKDTKEFYFKDGNIIWFKNKNLVSSEFIEQLFKTRLIKKQILGASPITTVATYTIDTAKNTIVFLPPLPEQKQIVKILEIWDKYLEKLSRKIEVKKNIKKGLMQRLLTGDVRLSGFSGEWIEKKLGDVTDIRKGTSFTKKELMSGNVPVIAGGQEPAYFHNVSNYSGDTITVSASGAYAGFIAKHNCPIFASDCSVIKSKKSDIGFIFNFLKLKQNWIYFALQVGGAQPHVYPKDLSAIKLKIPTIEEQIAIAKILTTADKEIEVLEKKKKIIEDQKKYLLNNLVTGNIIVNC